MKVGDTVTFRWHPDLELPDFPVVVDRVLGPHMVGPGRYAVGFLGAAPADDVFWQLEGGIVHVGPFLVDEDVPTP